MRVLLPFARRGSLAEPTPRHVDPKTDREKEKPQSDLGKRNFSYVNTYLSPPAVVLFLPIVFSINTRQDRRKGKKMKKKIKGETSRDDVSPPARFRNFCYRRFYNFRKRRTDIFFM